MEFSDYELQVFLDEVEEKLECLSENILILEREKDNEEAIKEMFRAAHTIKGSSGIMGYEKMTSLTHEMESILDQIRSGTLQVNTEIINLFFECIDSLKSLQEEIITKSDDFTIAPILAKISKMFEIKGSIQSTKINDSVKANEELNDIDLAIINDAQINGFKPLWIHMSLDSDCQMKGVRAYLVFHNLQDFGEVIKSDPDIEDIQDGNFESGFKVLLLSNERSEVVQAALQNIAEISSVQVSEISVGEGKSEVDNDILIATLMEPQKESENNFPVQELSDSVSVADIVNKEVLEKNIVAGDPQVTSVSNSNIKTNGNGKHDKKISQTVRVNVDKLDKLMNLVGELVIDRGRLSQVASELGVKIGSDELLESLGDITSHLAQVANELQDEIMKARMLPVDQVFNRFPRMVRDIAQRLNKEVDFNISGGETELDRTVIEAIGDPLIHLIRNALDHGLETPSERVAVGKLAKGAINLSARHQENYVMITIEDDGRGIDPEKLKSKAIEKGLITAEKTKAMTHQEALEIIFYPGFSTAETVNDVSGRGVGMDIVRTHIQSINGIIEIDSQLGFGTTIYIKLPLTLAIIQALLVKIEEQIYSFPLANVTEIFNLSSSDIKQIHNQEVAVIRGNILPLFSLADLFGIRTKTTLRNSDIFVVVIGIGEKRVGIIVDQLIGEQEIVIKTLGSYLGEVAGISGATILGDGRVALIVDVRRLISDMKKMESQLKVI